MPTLISIGVHVLSEKIRKIAVVEDDEDILVLLTGYFLKKGHEVLNAYSNATLNLFENEKPDLYLIR
jgi:DNA-binding response OmpR family regulator